MKYMTEDGRVFDNLAHAEEHEYYLTRKCGKREIFKKSADFKILTDIGIINIDENEQVIEEDVDTLIEWLFINTEHVLELLQ
jgi:hypothetical protein